MSYQDAKLKELTPEEVSILKDQGKDITYITSKKYYL